MIILEYYDMDFSGRNGYQCLSHLAEERIFYAFCGKLFYALYVSHNIVNYK